MSSIVKFFIIITLILLSGCSSKKFFEPKSIDGKYIKPIGQLNTNIITFNRDGATLANGEVITAHTNSTIKLPTNYSFINTSSQGIIATNNQDSIIIGNSSKTINVGGIIVSASIKGSLLAMVYSNNSIALYDLKTNQYLLKKYLNVSLANDIRIANPIFMTSIVLFPTLDGKVIVVALNTNKVIKTISVDTNETFNNIIYLKTSNDVLITATQNKIVSVSTDNLNIKSYNIRDIINHNQFIYIATIDGQLIKLDLKLNELSKRKYTFANFHALVFKDSLYALESQGFLIKVSPDFTEDKTYTIPFQKNSKTISLNNTFYFDNRYLTID